MAIWICKVHGFKPESRLLSARTLDFILMPCNAATIQLSCDTERILNVSVTSNGSHICMSQFLAPHSLLRLIGGWASSAEASLARHPVVVYLTTGPESLPHSGCCATLAAALLLWHFPPLLSHTPFMSLRCESPFMSLRLVIDSSSHRCAPECSAPECSRPGEYAALTRWFGRS